MSHTHLQCTALDYDESELRRSIAVFFLAILVPLAAGYVHQAVGSARAAWRRRRRARPGRPSERRYAVATLACVTVILLLLALLCMICYYSTIYQNPENTHNQEDVYLFMSDSFMVAVIPSVLAYISITFSFPMQYTKGFLFVVVYYPLSVLWFLLSGETGKRLYAVSTIINSSTILTLTALSIRNMRLDSKWDQVFDEYAQKANSNMIAALAPGSPIDTTSFVQPQLRNRKLSRRLYDQKVMLKLIALLMVVCLRIFVIMCIQTVSLFYSLIVGASAFFLDDFIIGMYVLLLGVFPWVVFLIVLWRPEFVLMSPVTSSALQQDAEQDNSSDMLFRSISHSGATKRPLLEQMRHRAPSDHAPSKIARTAAYVHAHWRSLCLYALFVIANVGLLAWGVHQACYSPAGAIGFSLLTAKSTAKVLSLDTGVIFLTIVPYLLSKLRESFVGKILPLDDTLTLHKLCGWILTLGSIAHTIAHVFNYIKLKDLTPGSPSWNEITRGNKLAEIYYSDNVFSILPVWTGFVLLAALAVIMVVGVIQTRCRNSIEYETFLWLHRGATVVFTVLICIHGAGRYLAFPYAWAFVGPPFLVFVFSRWWRVSNRLYISGRSYTFDVIEAHAGYKRGDGRVYVRLDVPIPPESGFSYNAGQYMKIKCGSVRATQWHDYTICSASPNMLTFIIEVRKRKHHSMKMTWSEELRAALQLYETDTFKTLPRLVLEGPLSTAAADAFHKEFILLVSTGTGITPMLSLWEALHAPGGAVEKGSVVRFLWICPSAELVENLLNQLVTVFDTNNNLGSQPMSFPAPRWHDNITAEEYTPNQQHSVDNRVDIDEDPANAHKSSLTTDYPPDSSPSVRPDDPTRPRGLTPSNLDVDIPAPHERSRELRDILNKDHQREQKTLDDSDEDVRQAALLAQAEPTPLRSSLSKKSNGSHREPKHVRVKSPELKSTQISVSHTGRSARSASMSNFSLNSEARRFRSNRATLDSLEPFDIFITRATESDPQVKRLRKKLNKIGRFIQVQTGRPADAEVRSYIDKFVAHAKRLHVERPGDTVPEVNVFLCGTKAVERVVREQAHLHGKNIIRSNIKVHAEMF